MAVAKAGSHYTVVKNDWFSTIALEAYGDLYKWKLILDANPQVNGRGVAIDGSPLIFPGDILWIPEEVIDEEEFDLADSFASQQSESFSVEVEGELIPVISGSLVKTMDTGTDSVDFEVDIDLLSEKARENLKPFRYPKLVIKINGELMLTGYVFSVEGSVDSGKRSKKCVGFAKTANLIDSSVNPPYEQLNVSLQARATRMCSDLGLSVVVRGDSGKPFDKVTSRSGEKRFEHLAKLAKERGLLVSNTVQGNVLFHRANEKEVAVDSIIEGQPGPLSLSSSADGRKRYSSYRITGKTISKQPVSKTVTDPFVSIPRYYCKNMERVSSGTVSDTVGWERSKAIADALSISVPMDRWTSKNGQLWKDNSYVYLESDSLDISGTNLLIRRVKFEYSASGKTATLDLVPKQVFLGGDIEDIWS